MSKRLTRRAVVAGIPAIVASTSVSAIAGTDHADAELIRLGEELRMAHQRERALSDADTPEDVFDAALKVCSDLAEQIVAIRATTLDGIRAKARAVYWAAGLHGEVDPAPCLGHRAADALLIDLLGAETEVRS